MNKRLVDDHLSTGPMALTDETLVEGLRFLSDRDRDLANLLNKLGPPPMWAREPGFPTLVHIILEQQVSLASARAAFDRLLTAVTPLTPKGFLALDDAALKGIGFSRQKIVYGRHLAHSIAAGHLDLAALELMPDEAVRSQLTGLKGIGPWTADVYLLMALRRPDIWPVGDLALAVAVQRIEQLSSRPTPETLELIGVPWRPWRAVAARLLWHFYLNNAG